MRRLPGDKLFVQLIVSCPECDVHHRAVRRIDRSLVEVLGIEIVVEDPGLLDVAALHRLESALFFQIIDDHLDHVDLEGGRCVEHRILLRLGLEIPDFRRDAHLMPEQILADDDKGETGGRQILLHTGVDHGKLRDIHGLGHDAGGHIGHQRHISGIRNVLVCRSEDRVVPADMDIIRVRIQRQLVLPRNMIEMVRLGGTGVTGILQILFRFFQSLTGEIAADDVVG